MMKKRLTSAALTLCLLLTMLPIDAWAEPADPTPTAPVYTEIDDFAKLRDALTTADAGVPTYIRLKNNISDRSSSQQSNLIILAGCEVFIDLNGCNLVLNPHQYPAAANIFIQGTLTVEDSTATAAPKVDKVTPKEVYTSGSIDCQSPSGGSGIHVDEGGSFVLKSGKITQTRGSEDLVAARGEQAAVRIESGCVLANRNCTAVSVTGAGASLVMTGGVLKGERAVSNSDPLNTERSEKTVITISGGGLIGAACGIEHLQPGFLTIEKGDIYAHDAVGIQIDQGELTMKDGSIVVRKPGVQYDPLSDQRFIQVDRTYMSGEDTVDKINSDVKITLANAKYAPKFRVEENFHWTAGTGGAFTAVKNFVITFKADDTTDSASETITANADGTLPRTPNLRRGGYVCAGWSRTAGGSAADIAGDKLREEVFTADTTLYAVWEPVQVTFYFDYMGDLNWKEVETVDENNLLARDQWPDTTRNGYVFKGWLLGVPYGRPVSEDEYETFIFGDHTNLYAQWDILQNTVTFDANGGTLAAGTDSQTVPTGQKVTMPAKPSRDGYTFDGWYTEKECTTAWIFAANTVDADITLYAKWTPKENTVTFDANGGTLAPDTTDQTVETDQKAVKPTDPTRDGYTFGGWYTEEACTTPWDFDADVVTGDTTLYAKWTGKTYAVTFDLNDAPDAPAAGGPGKQTVAHGGKAAEPDDPTRTDYTFGGWFKEKGCATAWDFDTDTVTGDTTLYAKWTLIPKNYAVTLDPRGGSLDGQASVLTTNDYGKLDRMPAAPSHGSYTFKHWVTFDGMLVTTDTVFSGPATIYAMWEKPDGTPDSDAVTFDLNYDGVPAAPEKIDIGADHKLVSALPAPERQGYDFDGWFTDRTGGTKVVQDTLFYASLTLYAHWTQKPAPAVFTITFDLNDSDTAHTHATKTTGAGGKIDRLPDEPTRTGYTFDGWYTARDGGDRVTADTSFSADATVYAHWTQVKKHTVTFALNYDGAPAAATAQVEDGGKTTAPARPSRAGYTFDGWFKEEGCTTAWNFDTDTVTSDTTLYAKWTAASETFTITFNANGGVLPTGGEEATMTTGADGKLTAEPPEATRTGYTFAGWYTQAGTQVTVDRVFRKDTTAYAKWAREGETAACTVTFYWDESDGAEVYKTCEAAADGTIQWPDDPQRENSSFKGWFRDDDTQCEKEAHFLVDTSLYARWGEKDTSDDTKKPPYTITLHPNGGALADPENPALTTDAEGKLSAAPKNPTYAGYTFLGWFTEAAGGTAVDVTKPFTGDADLYAHWRAQSPAPSGDYYSIDYPDRVTGGTFDVRPERAREGTRVTIELNPRSSYELDLLEIVNLSTGGLIRYWEDYADEITFTMPDSDVRIEISYQRRDSGGGWYYVPTEPVIPMTGWYYQNGRIYTAAGETVGDRTLLTRDMLLSILYNREGGGAEGHQVWATTSGIVPNYYEGGFYGTDKPLSREQTALLLFSYARHKGYGTAQRASLTGYSDYQEIRPAAQTAMSWARGANLMNGTTATTLSPGATLTCAQACVLLQRFSSNVSWGW